MGRIYLVRHGQTAWNKARIFRGRADVPLNEQGRREAACAAEALRAVPLTCVYTSPLSRARETGARGMPSRPVETLTALRGAGILLRAKVRCLLEIPRGEAAR